MATMWSPAASALRSPVCRRPRALSSSTPSTTRRDIRALESQSQLHINESLSNELYRLEKALRKRKVELDHINAEIKSVMKRLVIATVGLPLLAWFVNNY